MKKLLWLECREFFENANFPSLGCPGAPLGCPGAPLGRPWGLRECLRELPVSSRGAPGDSRNRKRSLEQNDGACGDASRDHGEG